MLHTIRLEILCSFQITPKAEPENQHVVRCEIWYHFYNLKNVKNTDGGVLILVKLQAEG